MTATNSASGTILTFSQSNDTSQYVVQSYLKISLGDELLQSGHKILSALGMTFTLSHTTVYNLSNII